MNIEGSWNLNQKCKYYLELASQERVKNQQEKVFTTFLNEWSSETGYLKTSSRKKEKVTDEQEEKYFQHQKVLR